MWCIMLEEIVDKYIADEGDCMVYNDCHFIEVK